MSFDRTKMKLRAAELAARGIYIGTSSWKYAGWCDLLYETARYEWRGKFATSRFEKNCLAEYAQVFKTVCVDAAYYAFPNPQQLQGLASQVPDDFRFAFKVTDDITLKHFPNLPRFAGRAGLANPDFLNANRFANEFLGPCAAIRDKVGTLMFEFSRFHNSDYAHGRDFLEQLDTFLSALPAGWPYAVEIRNRQWLQPDYFQCLQKHGVAHVLNSWEAMPPISEQMALPGSFPNPNLAVARFLLKPGRRYEDAVKAFVPYSRVVEINEDARDAGRRLILRMLLEGRGKTFIYVNNRLEGNALDTIEAMVGLVGAAENRASTASAGTGASPTPSQLL